MPVTETHHPETGTWLEDDRGNKCSVEYFGSRAAAREALASLHRCRDCVNCRDCAQCYRCVRCVGCLDCGDCKDCRDCASCYKHDALSLRTGDGLLLMYESDTPDAPLPPVPVLAGVHQLVHAAVAPADALDMGDWHTCETTHCRAGWVVHLAGAAGRELEQRLGTPLAATLIYRASSPLPVPLARFYDDEGPARADIARLAALEAAGASPGDAETSHANEAADVPHTVDDSARHAGRARDRGGEL